MSVCHKAIPRSHTACQVALQQELLPLISECTVLLGSYPEGALKDAASSGLAHSLRYRQTNPLRNDMNILFVVIVYTYSARGC